VSIKTLFLTVIVLGIFTGCSTGNDDDKPGPVSITINDVEIEEGASGNLTQAIFTVSLSKSHSSTVSVNYTTEDAEALAGEDYQSQQGTIDIAPGETTHTININVIGDFNGEENETFTVRLTTPVNGELSREIGTATIVNDDPIAIQRPSVPIAVPPEVSNFRDTVYANIFRKYSCKNCHYMGGQGIGAFADDHVVIAYQSFGYINPYDSKEFRDQSNFVMRIENGHFCWTNDCATDANELRDQIDVWVATLESGGFVEPPAPEFPSVERYLKEPPEKPVSHKIFDVSRDMPDLFLPVYDLVRTKCSRCHDSTPIDANVPMFAHDDIAMAYEVVSGDALVDLSFPELSDLYLAIKYQHNCWSGCESDSAEILALINDWSNHPSVTAVPFDNSITTSSAIRLNMAQAVGSEMRYNRDVIAQYLFTEGSDDDPDNDSIARDSSSLPPLVDLTLNENVQWIDDFGIRLGEGGSAISADIISAQKLHDIIARENEYSIEAWLNPHNTIQTGAGGPGNESAVIVSYAYGSSRNFILGQNLSNYLFIDEAIDRNAVPAFSTPSGYDYVQTGLQHVVLTYNDTEGRRLYINGLPVLCDMDIVVDDNYFLNACSHIKEGEKAISRLVNWNPSSYLKLGNSATGDNPWIGDMRFLAIHKTALNQKQILHNLDAGVGRRFHVLFNISNIPGVSGVGNRSYIWFQLVLDDNNNYVFHSPKFVDLDFEQSPVISFAIKGMRIGINGREANVTQAFSELGITEPLIVNTNPMALSAEYITVPSELGRGDQFFLIFDEIVEVPVVQ